VGSTAPEKMTLPRIFSVSFQTCKQNHNADQTCEHENDGMLEFLGPPSKPGGVAGVVGK
jgi:hypothetical protein